MFVPGKCFGDYSRGMCKTGWGWVVSGKVFRKNRCLADILKRTYILRVLLKRRISTW